MKLLLFLCTGNYYRSRFAHMFFNSLARQRGLSWHADSRGLALDPSNPGPMSRSSLAALRRLGVSWEPDLRPPLTVTDADFEQADHVVAVKEAEHRSMIERSFPHWLSKVEFWHVHDLDCCGPEETLPHLELEVLALVERLEAE